MKHANFAFFIPHLGCPHRCSFCDQQTIAETKMPPSPAEVAAALSKAEALPNAEIAFFGGSFTALPPKLMLSYLEAAAPFVGKNGFSGIRLSTRPDALSAQTVSLLSRYPITAVELGAQSMDDRVLALNERGHTAADVEEAAKRVYAAGWSLGVQMMTGLYGDTPAGSIETAKRLIACKPDTVRIYPTVVLPDTRLAKRYLAGEYDPPDPEKTLPLCAELLSLFEAAGVRVIRLGLHASPEIEKTMLAGCYHPALRELCSGYRLSQKIKTLLSGQPEGNYTISVAPADLSALIGHGGKWLQIFAQEGFRLRAEADRRLIRGEINLKKEGDHAAQRA